MKDRKEKAFVKSLRTSNFWKRFDYDPDFSNLRVLDFGCGFGGVCVDAAKRNASEIVGIDINRQVIKFAEKQVSKKFPQFRDRIKFKKGCVEDLPGSFDVIICKDVFEHVQEIEHVFQELIKKLEKNGELIIGFGPFFHSPIGDHALSRYIPWIHLFFPKKIYFNLLCFLYKVRIENFEDMHLNEKEFSFFKKMFYSSGLEVKVFRVNAGPNPLLKLFSLVRKIRFLDKYCTINVYCILKKID